ncbi:DUF1003 domain-containing protein [Aggregicoccus sp. 17bor-14]|uniref:DUF1003 domain-containing protein n=1 Tax=Myxococcaceae TaxID=31 RepID=UPI00129C4EB3|nr:MULTISPECIES: DUF1003 domain-containing protein [Myxococcaceae]MBF5045948.1 DUF1003 domain-containing protein [Simulacricoccus sp. 17bor-14]MRI91680.1 DUF1003 domain-containing protein [Aggregicoccus sp. 17bor-14]
MPADATLLTEVPLFAELDEAERAVLAAQLDEVRVAAGARVFSRGDPGGAIYIVAEGEVEISVEDTTGQRIVFETACRGDFFGELSLLDGDPRSADALAVKETRALRVDRQDLQLLFQRHPGSAMDVLTVMGRRLREADRHLRQRPNVTPNQAVDEQVTPVQRVADFLSAFSGTFRFLLMHAVWFAVWIALNLGAVPAVAPFDPYPFGLLTMVVSLEAIFLSCFVLISQSRSEAKERVRSDAEYEANIRAGLEVTQLHVKVDHLYEQVMGRLDALERGAAAAPSRPAGGGARP